MKFDVNKIKEIARPMSVEDRQEISFRNENRDWLALSAKFALTVRHILRSEKITQTELASRMGVSCVQVSKILSGKENIGLQTIAKIERALDRSIVTFIEIAKQRNCSIENTSISPKPHYSYSLPADVYVGVCEPDCCCHTYQSEE